ncbi:MAG TPA: NADH-quinone oxidoreductase subunit NuoG [Woeseiaceae bacterium]|nr:NADH-quinone oxidoreductase subunit NuoG [Woeseiaceae bacterium]
MSDDLVKIEIDGRPVEARKGQMLIEVTDRIGTYVPRFCYHEKLSIAANCRMCLIEVEKAPKPLPACATPVAEGMKVFTRSPRAISAQKATMEFLLINHPLDCPICDQGGECELQDLAMGYGRDISRYNEGKRAVQDKDIGPLVSTDMTRCIHCTRCVRFGEEIQGIQELGTTDRGENMKIGTYIEKSVDHELSANIIDLCPVGALNNKPYRYSARAWEMLQRPTIAAHDCVGSNLYAHVLRGRIKRVVPRENEAINETWISDRDRFSYEGIYSPDRLPAPMVRDGASWRELDWEAALELAAERLGRAREKTGFLVSPSATLEEGHLVAQLAAHLGTANLDHRLSRRDTRDQDGDPRYPSLGMTIAELEQQLAIFVVGSHLRHEAPILAHRVRKASLAGAKVSFATPEPYEYYFRAAATLQGAGLVELLAGVAVAACGDRLPESVAGLCDGVTASAEQASIAESLASSSPALVLLGNIAGRHAAGSAVRALAAAIAGATGATLGSLSEGANTAGLHLAGVLPHRGAGGVPRPLAGRAAAALLDEPLDAVVLLNVEPDADLMAAGDATERLSRQGFVIALTPFVSDALRETADLLLPIGTFAETSGTYVNVAGDWQSFAGVANPVGAARPAWKVLRVLGNLLGAPGFDYVTSEAVRDELAAALGSVTAGAMQPGKSGRIAAPNGADAPEAHIDVPIYSVDGVVRRADALQRTRAARRARGEGV